MLCNSEGHDVTKHNSVESPVYCKNATYTFRQPDGGEGSVPWKEFELTERNYLDLDITTTQKKDWNPDMVEFWSKKLPPIEIEPDTILVHDEL